MGELGTPHGNTGSSITSISSNHVDERSQAVNKRCFRIQMLVTNARSLAPKIRSLISMFDELDLHFAIITESWLKDGQTLDRDVIDLEYGSELKIIYKNRPTRSAGARQVGGGVSIIFNKRKCSFRERRIASGKFELVIASGKINGFDREIAIIAIYIQPKMKVDELATLRDLITDQVLQMKARVSNEGPVFFIGGDLNHRDLGPAFSDFNDITRANFDPTRGNACLDVLYTNMSSPTCNTFPALVTERGIPSDHACLVVEGEEVQERNFVWIKKVARKHTQLACDNFALRIADTNWTQVLGASEDPDVLVENYENYTGALVDELFPPRTVRVRSNESPWITDGIRALSRRKKRAYRRGKGKTRTWHRLQQRLTQLVDHSKAVFVDNVTRQGTSTKTYFNAVKTLNCKERPEQWGVESLFPGVPLVEAGNKTAEYFTRISNQYQPLLSSDLPGNLRRRAPMSEEEVAAKLKAANKPNSSVKGDLLPRLMKRYHHLLVRPVTRIFNAVFAANKWPKSWRKETAVIIPKVSAPASLAECRNISCTSFLSKVLESVLLQDLRSEIGLDPIQYGGLKGSSVDHLLVDAWDAILRPLDSGSHAVMLGIDYEKAFNRLDHNECLEQLRLLGASEQSLGLVRAFLTDRSVQVKLAGGTLSDLHKLFGGSPQGSILGCLLYCLATQQINLSIRARQLPRETRSARARNAPASPGTPESNTSDAGGFGLLQDEPSPPPRPVARVSPPAMGEERVEPPTPPQNQPDGIIMMKYIDDTTTIEAVPGSLSTKHFTTRTTVEEIFPEATSDLLASIITRTEEIGMKVNCSKTQLICISLDNGCKTQATIHINGTTIEGQEQMKLLGYMFGNTPDANAQFECIRKKFRARFWSIIHLRRSGISGMRLFKLYVVFLRSVIETNCVIYDSMLTVYQSDQIEMLQKRVIKLCFGPNASYTVTCQQYGIQTLKERRKIALEKFVRKSISNRRFAEKWFKPRPADENNLRNRRPYVEDKARTTRFQRSPLLTMQKLANDIATRN